MLNKLASFLKQYNMLQPGDTVICAVSGGADSVAMLFAFHLLKQKLGITLQAAHYNHRLRGEESDRDEAFVRWLCAQYDVPLHVGRGDVTAGKKGLEAAAREARYAFFKTLSGKIATGHTADDNAETVLMHLIRGTGLKGLGGIAPVNGVFIRPMLALTRNDVLAFLDSYHLDFVNDSSNETDLFLRNRIRHHVMPILKQENPRLSQNISASALRLRDDEALLCEMATVHDVLRVSELVAQPAPLRRRSLASFLEKCGVTEPEAEHIALAEGLVFSEKPSARAVFAGGVTIARNYDRLEKAEPVQQGIALTELPCPGVLELPQISVRIVCRYSDTVYNDPKDFTVFSQGKLYVRSRVSGDEIRTAGGTKSLKKMFIDKKIPASTRAAIPVIADDNGVLGVCGFGPNLDRRTADKPAIRISFEDIL